MLSVHQKNKRLVNNTSCYILIFKEDLIISYSKNADNTFFFSILETGLKSSYTNIEHLTLILINTKQIKY